PEAPTPLDEEVAWVLENARKIAVGKRNLPGLTNTTAVVFSMIERGAQVGDAREASDFLVKQIDLNRYSAVRGDVFLDQVPSSASPSDGAFSPELTAVLEEARRIASLVSNSPMVCGRHLLAGLLAAKLDKRPRGRLRLDMMLNVPERLSTHFARFVRKAA